MHWKQLGPLRSSSCSFRIYQTCQNRRVHNEAFHRLSRFWTPTGGASKDATGQADSNALLVKAGFIQPSHAGIFQFLPLGLRVQEKIERLVDKHMRDLGASKVSLSTLSSEELWKKSGRLQEGTRSELFSLEDRKGSRFLLSPTHEEEITSLVRSYVQSYRDLPVRLYQVTRKYRDEPRPRQGLLRTREFLMKDLYTFDSSTEAALETYETVRQAYRAFFEDLKLPYIVAEADSGNIGGDLSHEYHIASSKGEDQVYSCSSCNLSFNEEVLGTNKTLQDQNTCLCPRCSKEMTHQTTIELGHTFYLGTKYSKPLDATIAVQDQGSDLGSLQPIEMGCHGIGISRIIAGVANLYTDSKGLGWSRAIAPFELIIMQSGDTTGTASELATLMTGYSKVDTIVDDRQKSLVWKMKDADLIGYPIIAILGKAWEKEGKIELQCRRLGFRQNVEWGDMPEVVTKLLEKY